MMCVCKLFLIIFNFFGFQLEESVNATVVVSVRAIEKTTLLSMLCSRRLRGQKGALKRVSVDSLRVLIVIDS